jgi:CelD/BcsL family acetyltransferase involved in cellulose biosynthesis
MTRLAWSVEREPPLGALPAELSRLWRSDLQRNPFASPAFLAVMERETRAAGATPVWSIGRAADGEPRAVWPLRLTRAGRLELLPWAYSDHRSCISDSFVSPDELADGLDEAIRTCAPSGLRFFNVPSWGPTLAAARLAGARGSWHWRAFPAWACPVLRAEPGLESAGGLRQAIERHRRVRGYANAMSRLPGYGFEVLEDDRELADWAREFCDAHEWRWSTTPTPSEYSSAGARALFQEVLAAWARDGVLVRFALRLDWGRAALVAALRAGDRLVYHHVAVSPAAEQHRAGHVLIRLIALWMSEQGLHTLDFGVGNEAYKGRYANGDEPVWRVLAASRRTAPVYLRGVMEARIRESPRLQRGWDRVVNGYLRGPVAAGWASTRLRLRRHWRRAGSGLAWVAAPAAWGQGQPVYRASGLGGSPGGELAELATSELLGFLDRVHGVAGAERAAAFRLRHSGAVPLAIAGSAGPLHACWMVPAAEAPRQQPGDWWILEVGEVSRLAASVRERLYRLVLERLPRGQTALVPVPEADPALAEALRRLGFEPVRSGHEPASALSPPARTPSDTPAPAE